MKRTQYFHYNFTIILLMVVFSTKTFSLEETLFPIEIYSENPFEIKNGHIESSTFCLNPQFDYDPQQLKLRFKVHRAGYRRVKDFGKTWNTLSKLSIKIGNQGHWIDVKPGNPLIKESRRTIRAGGISGAEKVTLFDIEFNKTGSDQRIGQSKCLSINYRFNGSEGITNGLTILEVQAYSKFNNNWRNVTKTSRKKSLDFSNIRNGNPTRGGRLFQARNRLIKNVTRRTRISSSCLDCHAQGGADLHFYGYSNKAIKSRVKFHGLSNRDANDLVAYIRTYGQRNNIPTLGRPWNPPFQPGDKTRGLRGRNLYNQWMAGSGLEWVFETDKDKDNYILKKLLNVKTQGPVSITKNRLRGLFKGVNKRKRTINFNELPITIQLPDWNEWLPRISPIDVFSESNFVRTEVYQQYLYLRRNLNSLKNNPRRLLDEFTQFHNVAHTMFGGPTARDHRRGLSPQGVNYYSIARRSRVSREDARRSVFSWLMVKTWELVQEFNLQGFGGQRLGAGWEELSWPSNQFTAMTLGPHIIATNLSNFSNTHPYRNRQKRDIPSLEGSSQGIGYMESTQWYHLQLLLNPGFRQRTSYSPSDWPYHLMHIGYYHRSANKWELDQLGDNNYQSNGSLRYLATFIKSIQMRDQGPNTIADGFGWTLRYVSPLWLVSSAWNARRSNMLDDILTQLNTHHPQLRRLALETYLEVFLDKAQDLSRQNNWIRCSEAKQMNSSNWTWYCLPDSGRRVKTTQGNAPLFIFPKEQNLMNHLKIFLNLRAPFRNIGVNPKTRQRFDRWLRQNFEGLQLR